jgi:DNA-binding beta-propeller fold protein YncE
MKKLGSIGLIAISIFGCRCASTSGSASQDAKVPDAGGYETTADTTTGTASLPLVLVADVPLSGAPVRFDYQDFDPAKGNLVIAHMNDGAVVVVRSSDGSIVKTIPGIPTARGVVVADDVGRIFVTSSPNVVVVLDNESLAVIARVTSGTGPDGIGWDPKDKIVGVSDQGDGAASLIANAGDGARVQIPLGTETGNIVFDPTRGFFWITVVASSPPNKLVAIDPVAKKSTTSIPLPGCDGAHGLRIAPDGNSAFIACEGNDKVARVDLVGDAHAVDIADSGAGPDVLAIDPGLGWIYVAAESGNLVVFDLAQPGLVKIDAEHPGDSSHTVAVDPSTHHVFFPLQKGPSSTPVLRIMKPAGT